MALRIRIAPENKGLIEKALEEVNGPAAMHAFSRYSEIEHCVQVAESLLEPLLFRKDWQGAEATCISGQKVPASYRGVRRGTLVVLQRGSRDWFLIFARRCSLYPNEGGRTKLHLLPEQRDAAVARLETNFTVGRAHVSGV